MHWTLPRQSQFSILAELASASVTRYFLTESTHEWGGMAHSKYWLSGSSSSELRRHYNMVEMTKYWRVGRTDWILLVPSHSVKHRGKLCGTLARSVTHIGCHTVTMSQSVTDFYSDHVRVVRQCHIVAQCHKVMESVAHCMKVCQLP